MISSVIITGSRNFEKSTLDLGEGSYLPELLNSYPKLYEPPPQIEMFVHPFGIKINKIKKQGEIRYFVLTNENGEYLYGISFIKYSKISSYLKKNIDIIEEEEVSSIEKIYSERGISILSRFQLQKFLGEIINYYCKKLKKKIKYTKNQAKELFKIFKQCNYPYDNVFYFLGKEYLIPEKYFSTGLPHPNIHYEYLFESLSSQNILLIYSSILQERKIIFISKDPIYLVQIAESFRALLYPFIFPYFYIPMLPRAYIMAIEAPTPYIIGVTSLEDYEAVPTDAIIVDIDLNIISGEEYVYKLPIPLYENLKAIIDEHYSTPTHNPFNIEVKEYSFTHRTNLETDFKQSFIEERTSISFFHQFINSICRLFYTYHQYLILGNQSTPNLFNTKGFLLTCPFWAKKFLKKFTKSQIWMLYIDNIDKSNYFEQRISSFIKVSKATIPDIKRGYLYVNINKWNHFYVKLINKHILNFYYWPKQRGKKKLKARMIIDKNCILVVPLNFKSPYENIFEIKNGENSIIFANDDFNELKSWYEIIYSIILPKLFKYEGLKTIKRNENSLRILTLRQQYLSDVRKEFQRRNSSLENMFNLIDGSITINTDSEEDLIETSDDD